MLRTLHRTSRQWPQRVVIHSGSLHRIGYRCQIPNETLTVLAIETSCDDTSVAVVKSGSRKAGVRLSGRRTVVPTLDVLFHERVTANNEAYTGIHPLVALESHRANLAPLVQQALTTLSQRDHDDDVTVSSDKAAIDRYIGKSTSKPDLVAVTRGPGMRSNLSVGIDTAKGLAVAWDVPLIGVHHMQAHALTPRLLVAQHNHQYEDCGDLQPAFPFLSVLVSGGHTLLMDSSNLTEHTILAETQDIAIGDFLDKAARVILPSESLKAPFGRALEQFAFQSELGLPDVSGVDSYYDYVAPARRQDELVRRSSEWGWALAPPLAESKGGDKSSRRMVYSFAGLLSAIERLMRRDTPITLHERQVLARETQRVAFEHLASRILLYVSSPTTKWNGDTIVVSGGVASNQYLRHVLRSILDARGYEHIKLSFPPAELCTDNALMIAWAAIEMFQEGYTSTLDIGPLRKWPMDANTPDGGILAASGWQTRMNDRPTD